MVEKHISSNASHGVAGYCIILGLAIAWQYFRGDFFARYLCFVVGDVPAELGTLFYYAFLIALVLFAFLHPVFHAQLDRALRGPLSVPLLCSAAASPVLMLFANACGGAAQVLLGWLYEKGYSVPQDYAKAKDLYEKAALQGNQKGQDKLAVFYRLGKGTPKDPAKANYWADKAMQQGDCGSAGGC